MARGRYAASAAKRRAESAEEQLDRLMPKLVEAQKLARQYRSEAEAAPVLRRQLEDLRRQVGMPVAKHEQTVREMDEQHRARIERERDAFRVIIGEFSIILRHLSAVEARHNARWITPALLEAFAALPAGICRPLFRVMDVDRAYEREMEQPGAAENIRSSMVGERWLAAKTTPWLSSEDLETIRKEARAANRSKLESRADYLRGWAEKGHGVLTRDVDSLEKHLVAEEMDRLEDAP